MSVSTVDRRDPTNWRHAYFDPVTEGEDRVTSGSFWGLLNALYTIVVISDMLLPKRGTPRQYIALVVSMYYV